MTPRRRAGFVITPLLFCLTCAGGYVSGALGWFAIDAAMQSERKADRAWDAAERLQYVDHQSKSEQDSQFVTSESATGKVDERGTE